ncbi:lipopolysaccharide biosynthesis protein [Pseudarthrobacter polychromogenes]|uniref:lipopolysaccharide biosynthesis protein n=1 Tax=Pseudarthrobacter polychromogenes TaxID=1676 RepID=UPI0016682628|nr:hypothetical protein [Pseudarthrobacter polychromogenes]
MSFVLKLWKQRKFGSALAFRIAARLIASIGQAAFLLLLAREIGPADFGVVAIVLSIGYMVMAVTSFGTSTRVLRLAAETEPTIIATKLLYLRLLGTLVTATTCLAVAYGYKDAAFIAVFMIASDQAADYAQAYLAGTNRQIFSSFVVIGQRIIPLGALWVSNAAGLASPQVVMMSFAATLAISIVIPFRERCKGLREVGFLAELRASSGYWMSSIAPNISQLQVPALGMVLEAATVGLFAVAARLTNPFTIMVSALQTVLMPELSRRRGTASFHTLYRASVAASLVYGGLLAFSAWFLADIVISLLGSEYTSARMLIVGMIIASGLSSISQALQSKLLVEGRGGDVAWSIGVGSTVGLACLMIIAVSAGEASIWLAPILAQAVIAVGLAWRANTSLPWVGRHTRR